MRSRTGWTVERLGGEGRLLPCDVVEVREFTCYRVDADDGSPSDQYTEALSLKLCALKPLNYSYMPGELSREEKRAIRKAEKRKAKFGTEVAADAPKSSSESTQQQQQGLLSGGDVGINDAVKVRITPPYLDYEERVFLQT